MTIGTQLSFVDSSEFHVDKESDKLYPKQWCHMGYGRVCRT